MKQVLQFHVTGTISRVRLYLDDEKIDLNSSGRGQSRPRETGTTSVLNYSGIGFQDSYSKIKIEHGRPDKVEIRIDGNNKIIVEQFSVLITP
jgi:hypothetical protein